MYIIIECSGIFNITTIEKNWKYISRIFQSIGKCSIILIPLIQLWIKTFISYNQKITQLSNQTYTSIINLFKPISCKKIQYILKLKNINKKCVHIILNKIFK